MRKLDEEEGKQRSHNWLVIQLPIISQFSWPLSSVFVPNSWTDLRVCSGIHCVSWLSLYSFVRLHANLAAILPNRPASLPFSVRPLPLLILHYAVRNEGRVQGGGPQNHAFESHCRFKPCEKPKATHGQTLSPAARQGPKHLLCLCPSGCSFSCHPAINKSPKVRVI